MIPISITYQGRLRCTATHDNSGTQFITDAPKDNFGSGESFSPTDLVAAALGTCIITTIGIQMRNEDILLDSTHIAVEKHMSAMPPRRIAKIVARLTFPPGISAKHRNRIEHIARNCPVAKSLHPDIELDVAFQYPD